jgi:hypothetical protein
MPLGTCVQHALVANDYPSGAFLSDCAVVQPSAAALDASASQALVEQTERAIAQALKRVDAKAAAAVASDEAAAKAA